MGDGVLYIGRWATTIQISSIQTPTGPGGGSSFFSTQYDNTHFVFGLPVTQLASSGQATYNLLMTTHSTGSADGTVGQGLLAGSQLAVDFGARTVGANLRVGHDNSVYQGQATANFTGAAPGAFLTNALGAASGPRCGAAPCTLGFGGNFAGTGMHGIPPDAGIVYQITPQSPTQINLGGCP
jgi:hypothetical protein